MLSNNALFGAHYWDNASAVEDEQRTRHAAVEAVMPNGVPVWVVLRDAEARVALADPRLSKDHRLLKAAMAEAQRRAGRDPRLTGMFGDTPLFNDGARHRRQRKLLQHAFTARRVRELQPRVEQIANELVDAFDTSGPVDMVAEFAFLLPITVICELIGVPLDDREHFRSWTVDLMQDAPEITNPASESMDAYFRELIQDKKSHLCEDLLSTLLQADIEGEQLTEQEVRDALFLILVAGHETVSNLIGNAVYALLAHPTRWQALVDEPTLAPAIVEEVLRWDSPVRHATHRITIEPVTIGDTVIPAGQIVLVALGAAGRDPAKYAHAAQFDMHRKDYNQHLGFGHGAHYCIGAPLARMEGQIGLTVLTRRLPHAALEDSITPSRHHSGIMNSLVSLLVRPNGH